MKCGTFGDKGFGDHPSCVDIGVLEERVQIKFPRSKNLAIEPLSALFDPNIH